MQSFLLHQGAPTTRAFMKAMELRANSSNNTVYADADGKIAYLHPQFVPRRDDRFDYTHPVDGSGSGHRLAGTCMRSTRRRTCSIRANGWIMNTNNWPYSAAGADSPKRDGLPALHGHRRARIHAACMPRCCWHGPPGFHARCAECRRLRLLSAGVRASWCRRCSRPTMTWPPASPRQPRLAGQILALRDWDYRWSVHSVATTLAALWGDQVWDARQTGRGCGERLGVRGHQPTHRAAQAKLEALAAVSDRLRKGLRNLAGAVGRDQSLAAHERRHRAELHR